MREPQHVGDQTVVIIEAHHHLLGHGGGKERPRLRQRLGVTQVNENDMPTREQLRVGPIHRMDRGDPAAVGPEGHEAGAQR
jgi:hypothetical protein